MARSIKEYALRSYDSATLFLPPSPLGEEGNLAPPDVYAESANPLYPIGTLAWYPGMGKKYRYSKAGGALVGTKVLVVNGNYVPDASSFANDGGFYGHCQEDGVAVAYDIGATVIYVTGTQNTAKNFYEGGHLVHFDAARAVCYEDSYVISGPEEASTTPWQNQKVTLHKAKKYAIVASDGIEIWCSPYSNILAGGSIAGYETCMGVPPIPIQSGYYFWLQTAGPVLITPNGWSTLCPGYAANSRIAAVTVGGSIITTRAASGDGYQIIGDILAATESGSADAFVNMDLDLGH